MGKYKVNVNKKTVKKANHAKTLVAIVKRFLDCGFIKHYSIKAQCSPK